MMNRSLSEPVFASMSLQATDWQRAIRRGIYTIPEAARLVGASQPKLRSWIEGNKGTLVAPIIQRQLPRVGGHTVLGFLDLIESKFVQHFTKWFSPQTIRKVSIKLRERHDVDHPFAMDKRFRTDGRVIFMEAAETEEELRVLNLMNDNFEMKQIIQQSLFDSIFYVNDIARHWIPNPQTNRVLIDPTICFGHPFIKDLMIPTRRLYDAYLVEGGVEEAAEEFEVDAGAIVQAVRFERALDERIAH
ncbi:MAG: DUF433 domain-containing protein [Alphaproteobacteria bacterium]|nr:DUF433 domain-containing protein [Alphaproteobacteria bacterium]